jgi:hypothetical protein
MCDKAAPVAGELMKALEPEFVQLLTVEGIASEPDGVAAIAAFNAAETALLAWVPGTTPSAELIEALDDVDTVFQGLPLPQIDKELAGVISATLAVIIGLVKGKSAPAPSAVTAAAVAGTPEAAPQIHEDTVEAATTAKVKTLVPGFKRSIFHTPAGNQKNAWNKGVATTAAIDPKYAVLKQ